MGLSFFWSCGNAAFAGVLFAPALKWSIFSFEPVAAEDTPNYQGMTGEVKGGYSFRQIFDIVGFVNYTAGNPGIFSVPADNANFVFYGGEIAARIAQSVYFALRGGTASYQLLKLGVHDREVPGEWTGPGFGFSLGGISAFGNSKRSSLQVSFDFLQAQVTELHAVSDEGTTRKIDEFSICMTYVLNGYHNAAIEGSFFSSYLNSLIFWE
jgi:hypothetical protein